MSNQNTQFCFNSEEKPSVSLVHQDEKFPFFLRTVFLCLLCVSTGSWFISTLFNKENNREIQSLPNPAVSIQNKISLNPFLIRLKTKQGFQLTKVTVALQASDSQVLEEIQQSDNQVRDHLIFILSNQNTSTFNDLKKRQLLEQEIVTQLNLFLGKGEIQKIEITDTSVH